MDIYIYIFMCVCVYVYVCVHRLVCYCMSMCIIELYKLKYIFINYMRYYLNGISFKNIFNS